MWFGIQPGRQGYPFALRLPTQAFQAAVKERSYLIAGDVEDLGDLRRRKIVNSVPDCFQEQAHHFRHLSRSDSRQEPFGVGQGCLDKYVATFVFGSEPVIRDFTA